MMPSLLAMLHDCYTMLPAKAHHSGMRSVVTNILADTHIPRHQQAHLKYFRHMSHSPRDL